MKNSKKCLKYSKGGQKKLGLTRKKLEKEVEEKKKKTLEKYFR